MRPAVLLAGTPRRHADLADSLAWGLDRVAHLADRSENHDLVVQAGRKGAALHAGGDPAGMSHVRAMEEFLRHLDGSRFRWYATAQEELAPGGALAYGFTANNRREFTFFEELTRRAGTRIPVLNVCDLQRSVGTRVDTRLRLVLEDVVREFLRTRTRIRPGLFAHLCTFGTSVQGAVATLERARSAVFVVANDHSPAPVAYTSVARALGMKTAYVQHAEVTDVFPPLDFDLSILRNRRSAEIYTSVGPVAGEMVVARRQWEHWLPVDTLRRRRERLARAAEVRVGLYPSRVFNADRLRSLVNALAASPGVTSVHVKPHPRAEEIDSALEGVDCEVISEVPDTPHVAICGTSSVVSELLAHGAIVFHDRMLDDLSADYYGFSQAGLVRLLPSGRCPDFFWKTAATDPDHRWNHLGRYLAQLDVPANRDLEESALASVRDFTTRIAR